MTNVVQLPLRKRTTDSAAVYQEDRTVKGAFSSSVGSEHAVSEGFAPSTSLYDLESPLQLPSFIVLAEEVISKLDQCMHNIDDDNLIQADTEFMSARRLLPELFMYRSLSDAVGHVVKEAISACANIDAISELLSLPKEVRWVIESVKQQPFMSFSHALRLTQALESLSSEKWGPESKMGSSTFVNTLLSIENS